MILRTWFALAALLLLPSITYGQLKAGAAVLDVAPLQYPVLVNGNMTTRRATEAQTPINARALVLDDGTLRLAIVVVDSCMMPRPLLDEAKLLASQRTKIPPDRILISATHTHTAPASMGCLGTDADPSYVPYLRERLAQVVAAAEARLQPARVGWAVANAAEFTALRRWIRRTDRIAQDPFGNATVRANMHAGRNWDDVSGESGPEDPDLTLISLQTADGRPLAVLANFSMHYFSGVQPLNADYFGLFCRGLQEQLGGPPAADGQPPFVAIMSHGCSGDIWRRDYTLRDYSQPASSANDEPSIESYSQGLLKLALQAYDTIAYSEDADLAMAEARPRLRYRVPDQQRLEWARRIVDGMGDRPPENTQEVYAREQILLHQRQSTEIVLQAIRIGDIAIATTPNETYALTGLKLKLQSPLPRTMVIELANGGDGYIPPPEQHWFGGYNTWAARSAGLEVEAEPKIVETLLGLLEQVAAAPRRPYQPGCAAACRALLDAKPVAYWRLDDFSGPRARDASNRQRDGIYEDGVAFFLEGPHSAEFCGPDKINRAAHFAGGRLRTRIGELGDHYSVSLWFWNGFPVRARETAGWIFSRGRDYSLGPHSEHVGLGGTASEPGRLIYLHGSADEPLAGRTEIERWSWNQLVFVRDGTSVRIHLNGNPTPEIETTADAPADIQQLFFGGRCDRESNWEGRLDEIAVFDRALSPTEIGKLAVP